jgi:phosphoribosylformylglycinamidine synthase
VDPRSGAALLVAESALNVACVGADPAAVVNCLNFGNPEHPEVMWQLSEAIDGMAEACRELSLPVVGGNVSLYNESGGVDIDPTPVVAVLGLVQRLERRPPVASLTPGESIMLLRPDPVDVSLSGSKWAVEVHAHRGRGETLPALDFTAHRRLLRLVADLVGQGVPSGVHDVSEGGLAAALAEMAVASGCGFVVSLGEEPAALDLFGEGPSRVVICLPDALCAQVRSKAGAAGLVAVELGRAGGERLVIEGAFDVALSEVKESWGSALASSLAPGGFDGH